MLALLRSIDPKGGGEIIVQGFTCIALPNAIHAAGFTPVYVDIDEETLNIDTTLLEGKITSRTRAIICQHTFGIVADAETLRTIADRHGLLLIEDCAHVLPDVTGPKAIGQHGDALMLSFGRDKAVSGVTGGAIVTWREDLKAKLQCEEDVATEVPILTVKRLLLYPVLYALCKPLYGIGIGKALLWLSAKLRLLPAVLTSHEKQGYQSAAVHKLPNACAALTVYEFKNFHAINNHRRALTQFYAEQADKHGWHVPSAINANLPLQKFPIFTENADAIRLRLKHQNIHLSDGWSDAAVCPRSVNQEAAGYRNGSCPHAEHAARQILSLPTHPTMTKRQASRLIRYTLYAIRHTL